VEVFKPGFGADAPPIVYEVDGEQYIAIVTGGQFDPAQCHRRCRFGAFSLKGKTGPVMVAAPTAIGPIPGPVFGGVFWSAVFPRYGCPMRVAEQSQ